MKKLLIIVLLALSLSGCSGFNTEKLNQSVLTGGLSVTASIQNPVTEKTLLQVEQAIDLAFTGLNAYRKLCMVDMVLPPSCVDVLAKLQVYTKKVKPALQQLRKFVRQNDQVNAIIVYNALQGLLSDVKVLAAAQGAM